MTLRPAYTLGHSEYNAFLFAVVAEGEDGMPLTVLSAFSRLGLDPWQEAARLAGLPRDVATHALAETIARLLGSSQSAAASQATATELVARLPTGSVPLIPAVPADGKEAAPMAQAKKRRSALSIALPWAVMVVGLSLLFFSMQQDNNLEPGRAGGQSERAKR
jgi:hypothetical protein